MAARPGKILYFLLLSIIKQVNVKPVLIFFIFFTLWTPALGAPDDGKFIDSKFLFKRDDINAYRVTYKSDGLKVNGLLFLKHVDEKLPCVIFCHDGVSGISREHRLSSIRLARAGYAVFCPSYRGEDGSEGSVEIAKGEVNDVLNAITLVSKIKQIDSNRIALAGTSHGALICVLAASRTDKIKALVSAYGVMDIYKWWYYLKDNDKLGKDKLTRDTYGDGPDSRPKSFKIRNAVFYVKNINCPVLILQGKKDDIVPPEQAVILKETLDKYNIKNELAIYPDCLHGFLIYAPYIEDAEKKEKEQTEAAWELFISFLNKNLNNFR